MTTENRSTRMATLTLTSEDRWTGKQLTKTSERVEWSTYDMRLPELGGASAWMEEQNPYPLADKRHNSWQSKAKQDPWKYVCQIGDTRYRFHIKADPCAASLTESERQALVLGQWISSAELVDAITPGDLCTVEMPALCNDCGLVDALEDHPEGLCADCSYNAALRRYEAAYDAVITARPTIAEAADKRAAILTQLQVQAQHLRVKDALRPILNGEAAAYATIIAGEARL